MSITYYLKCIQRKVSLLSVLLFLGLVACKKKGELNSELIKSQQTGVFSDTATIQASTQVADISKTSWTSFYYGLCGSYSDPYFGTNTSTTACQILLTSGNLSGLDTLFIDSAEIVVEIRESYGLGSSVEITAYELIENIDTESDYVYDMNTEPTFGDEIGASVYTTGTDTLKIPVNSSFINKLQALSDDNLSSNDLFTSLINGIFFKSTSGDNILSLNYQAKVSGLNLYYTVIDSTYTVRFPFDETAIRYNYFTLDASSTPANESINQISDTTYLQPMGGTMVKISFPHLKSFVDSGNVTINNAELSLPILEGSAENYASPTSIVLKYYSDSSLVNIPDVSRNNYGGTFNSAKDSYTFNITYHLQSYLNGEIESGDIYAEIWGKEQTARRLILENTDSSPFTLKLTYTK